MEQMKQDGLSMQIDKESFAMELKKWRLRQNLTQKEVATRWGCSRFTIMRAERAKEITWEMAYKMFTKLSHELRNEVHDNH